MRATSPLITAIAMIGALFSSGLALAQPASTGETAIDPVDTSPGAGMNFTLGAGAGVAPDYEGSDDYQLVPLWNLRDRQSVPPEHVRAGDRAAAAVQLLPSDHWRLGLSGQFIKERDDVEDDQVDDLEKVDPSAMLGVARRLRLLRRSTAASDA